MLFLCLETSQDRDETPAAKPVLRALAPKGNEWMRQHDSTIWWASYCSLWIPAVPALCAGLPDPVLSQLRVVDSIHINSSQFSTADQPSPFLNHTPPGLLQPVARRNDRTISISSWPFQATLHAPAARDVATTISHLPRSAICQGREDDVRKPGARQVGTAWCRAYQQCLRAMKTPQKDTGHDTTVGDLFWSWQLLRTR